MKLNANFKLRSIAGETIIVSQGTPDVDFTRIISLNASARLLWEELSGREFTLGDAVEILKKKYGITEDRAQEDVSKWIDDLKKCGIISEF